MMIHRSTTFLTITVVLMLVHGGCRSERKTLNVPLIDELSRARITAKTKNHVTKKVYKIQGEQRRVLFMHPSSTVEFELLIPAAAKLQFGLGIAPGFWNRPGDGVRFTVKIDEGTDETKTVFSRYINPKSVEPDRRWHDAEVDLSLYEGQKVKLILSTDGGPNDNNMFDNAGWSEPILTGLIW